MTDDKQSATGTAGKATQESGTSGLAPAARRALAEAEARRAAAMAAPRPETEISGRGGLEPVRYGDWEIKGLTSDF